MSLLSTLFIVTIAISIKLVKLKNNNINKNNPGKLYIILNFHSQEPNSSVEKSSVSNLNKSSIFQFAISMKRISRNTENGDNTQHPSQELGPWRILVTSIRYARPIHAEPDEDHLKY